MRWEDAKKTSPQQWVIVEAVEAHTEGDKRIIENIQLSHISRQSRKALFLRRRLKSRLVPRSVPANFFLDNQEKA